MTYTVCLREVLICSDSLRIMFIAGCNRILILLEKLYGFTIKRIVFDYQRFVDAK